MELTPFQLKKQRHYFNVYDADKNGVIEQADFEDIGHRFAIALGHQPGGTVYNYLREGFLGVWHEIQKDADANSDGHITFEEFLRYQQRTAFDATPEAFAAYIGARTRGLNA